MGSVYFVVKTALGADTERKRRTAEKTTPKYHLPNGRKAAERLKTPDNLITPLYF